MAPTYLIRRRVTAGLLMIPAAGAVIRLGKALSLSTVKAIVAADIAEPLRTQDAAGGEPESLGRIGRCSGRSGRQVIASPSANSVGMGMREIG